MRAWPLAVVLSLAATALAGPHPGRIVRVERPRTGVRGTPRICQVNPGDMSMSCFGQPPAVGESGNVVANTGIIGQIRVTKVEAQNQAYGGQAACTDGLWRAETEIVDGISNPNTVPYGSWFILDVGMLASAKLADAPNPLPGGQNGESAAVTLDKDGDNTPEFLVTWYPCNSANPTGSSQTYCVDFWSASSSGSHWSKSRSDSVTWCM